MSAEYVPKTFWELVSIMDDLPFDDCVDNEDTGKLRRVMCGYGGDGYDLFEADENGWLEFIGSTNDVIQAAEFIAEGWEVYENLMEDYSKAFK